MNTPPFLLGAALLFWGWQTGFFMYALLMAVVLEGSRWLRLRWEFSDDDFSRIWIFCALLFLAAALYAFSSNDGPADFRGLFQNPTFFAQRNAGTASARTAAALIRWLPMIFFFFMSAQAFSSRTSIPLETISRLLRRRWKKAQKAGLPLPAVRTVNVSFAYFGVCLFAACAQSRDDGRYFWGLCVLLGWALWSRRSPRFNIAVWVVAFAIAMALGYTGQRGIGHLQHYFEGLNAQWLAGFSRRTTKEADRGRTAIGQIGRIKTSGQIMIRLEPREQSGPPPLLREASFRFYKSQAWDSGYSKRDLESIYPLQTNKEAWMLLPEKPKNSCVRICCYLDGGKGLLPLASGSGRLEHLPAYTLHKNKTGTVLAEGPGLLMFDNYYGAGASIDSPPEDEDKDVPHREAPALEKVLKELQLSGQSTQEKLRSINRFFQSKFTYSMWQERERTRTNETPLGKFLLRSRKGHCEYFATATVLLLRQLDIPARYAVGYAVHEASGSKYIVRQRDAHAWALVWNDEQKIWQDFDTTPASWIQAESQRASSLEFVSDAFSRVGFEISKLRWGQYQLRQYLLWSMAPVLVLLLFQIVFRSRRKRLGDASLIPLTVWPGADSEFYQVEQRLTARGLKRESSEPLSEWLDRLLGQPGFSVTPSPLQELLRLHYRYRFDPQGLSKAERERLRRQAAESITRGP